jgi:hypothetical protein
MSKVNVVGMALMPASQAVAWYLILQKSLYPSVFKVSAFYCAWALYNKYLGGQTKELGHISMGLLALAAYAERKYPTIAATALVLANFGIPAYYLLAWSPSELAEKVKGDTSHLAIVWARIFKAYFVSNLGLWSTVLYKLIKNNVGPSYQHVPVL